MCSLRTKLVPQVYPRWSQSPSTYLFCRQSPRFALRHCRVILTSFPNQEIPEHPVHDGSASPGTRLSRYVRGIFSSEKRLARVLLLLAHFGKDGKPEVVIPKISQETLAEMVGTTRSRVSFFMNRFRKLGFVRYNGELEVHSSLLNIVLHD